MSPRSQTRFFDSLNKIFEEQKALNQLDQNNNEEKSPEYTIVSAIDDSCVLFAVKETPSHNMENESGYNSGLL